MKAFSLLLVRDVFVVLFLWKCTVIVYVISTTLEEFLERIFRFHLLIKG